MTSPLSLDVNQRDGTSFPSGRNRTVSLSRSPRPYHRRSASLVASEAIAKNHGSLRSRSPLQTQRSSASSESGTEADDERGHLLKGLPAPPLRVRKGLRGGTPLVQTPAISPLPTPPGIGREDRKSYFQRAKPHAAVSEAVKKERKQAREKYTKRKTAEVTRRTTETILLLSIGATICSGEDASRNLRSWISELESFTLVILFLYCAYPFRLAYRDFRMGRSLQQSLDKGFHIPSRFDPGALLYPVILPCLVAISLVQQNPAFLLPNLILGLSSIPQRAVPESESSSKLSYVHWVVSIIPLVYPSNLFCKADRQKPHVLKTSGDSALQGEILVLLCPLQKALLPALEYLTTTSLDPSELELLSTALINIFLFSTTPQMEIIKALLWLGGLALFITCSNILSWEVGLARIPTWRFGKRKRPSKSFLSRLDYDMCQFLWRSGNSKSRKDSSDEEDFQDAQKNHILKRPKLNLEVNLNSNAYSKLLWQSMSATEPHQNGSVELVGIDRLLRGNAKDKRRNTFSAFDQSRVVSARTTSSGRPRRSVSPTSSSFLSLSLAQAQVRKWAYAFAIYCITLLVILIPIRRYISTHALSFYEPFGWALGYLFGNIPQFRFWVISNNFEKWISLPPRKYHLQSDSDLGWVEYARQTVIGPATTRLLLCGYCVLVLITGLAVVLRLTSVVEVDTRRKVFHGIMVAMLLPTIFIDPCFIALALVLTLAIFLLLDLFRASQLPPISKPLTYFLAPYVDGRDHRGPVIVSHIFLLIGCAIPLWLSLAGMRRTGIDPWVGWEVDERNVSMVSGVICVGMGDAAASLIGRRYGRTKWCWGGGKSLEGSTAFTVAVTVGLMTSYTWLRVGGWVSIQGSSFGLAFCKSIVAGVGASLLESTLTAANDNVVVPVGLWLLVRGLEI